MRRMDTRGVAWLYVTHGHPRGGLTLCGAWTPKWLPDFVRRMDTQKAGLTLMRRMDNQRVAWLYVTHGHPRGGLTLCGAWTPKGCPGFL